ncbi:PelD GGDEF domain-containing protein [Marinobacter lipolyticus]|uniref:PelD GGDEF domain-containing protein n=1 Tax=Marinobacter lipolyticus TaxID=209639 RepID=UPI003A90BC94
MADIVHEQQQTASGSDTELQQFRFQLDRAERDAREHNLPAALTLFSFASESDAGTVTGRVRQLRRGLDVVAELPADDRHQLAILLPLTDELGHKAYLQRLDDDIRAHTGKSLSELAMTQSLMITGNANAGDWLNRLLEGDTSS